MLLKKLLSIKEVAEKWKQQYCRNGKWGSTISGPAEETYQRILACASHDQLSLIIHDWATHWCYECMEYKDEVVSFGDGDECHAELCRECLSAASRLMNEAPQCS